MVMMMIITIQNLLFIDLSNLKHETYSLYPEFLQKSTSFKLIIKKIDFNEKTCPSDITEGVFIRSRNFFCFKVEIQYFKTFFDIGRNWVEN